ncbi:MAG TPA: glycoside hydrolase family 88 protein [Povalibacter sp.]|nr:glycoside hydrolase family 88 protein [Povalibacter sp.]
MKRRTLLQAVLSGGLLVSGLSLAQGADSFADWPTGSSPHEVGLRVAQRFVPAAHLLHPELRTIHYAEVATWYGALTYAELAQDKALTAQLRERFDPVFADEESLLPPVVHVDHSVFGAIPLELYRQAGRPRDRSLGLQYADGQWDNPLPDGLTNQTRFWIDDMYMITLLQVQAYRATGDVKYIDRAARQMAAYLERLQQPNGLFFHAPKSPFFWGRGNGWVAAGMSELLSSLPESHAQRAQILAGYQRMMASLLKYQDRSGMWRQLIDRPESWPESSSTGMFTFAFVTGVKRGWLDRETYGPAARKAWLALVGYINTEGDVREVCVGTGAGDNLKYYLDRPRSIGDLHGQAPILWSASALLR